MQIKNRTVYFPSFMRTSAYDFKGKIKKKEVKRIVQNEDFGENADATLRGTADIRSYYEYYDKKINSTYLEICEFPKPHDKGSYVLPQLVLRNSITQFPCIAIIPSENVTIVFNQYGLVDSYFKDNEFYLDEKVNYFQANFSEYDLMVFSTEEIDTYRVELIELSGNWQKKGKNELIGTTSEDKKKLPITPQKLIYGLLIACLITTTGLSFWNYQRNNKIITDIDNEFNILNQKIDDVQTQLKSQNTTIQETNNNLNDYIKKEKQNNPSQNTNTQQTLRNINNQIAQIQNQLRNQKGRTGGTSHGQLPDMNIANTPENQKILRNNILKAKKHFSVASYSPSSQILILRYYPYANQREITESITMNLNDRHAEYGTNDYKYDIIQDKRKITIQHNTRPNVKFFLEYNK